MAGQGFGMKGTVMNIQNTPQINQGARPEIRAQSIAPARAEPKPVAATSVQIVPQQVAAEDLKRAVATINQVMRQSNLDLEFSVDTDTRQTVVKMVDSKTGELIRQFPSEATLAISRSIDQFQRGMLLTQKA